MKKGIFKIIGMVVIMVLLLQTNTFVLAETKEQLEKKQNENNKQINQTQSELEEVQTEKSETTKQVEKLSTQIADYESQIEKLNGQITELNSKITQTEKELQKAQEDYTQQEALLNARLVATYEAGETSYLDFLLSSESIIDLISNYYLVAEVANSDTELLEKIEKQKQDIEKAKKELEGSKQELATSKASKQSVTTQLQTAKEEKKQQVAKLSEDEQKLQEKIEELRQANVSIDNEIRAAQAAIEAARRKQEEERKKQEANNSNKKPSNPSTGGSAGSGSVSSSGFIYPVPSGYTRITTGLNYSNGSYHGAVDFGSGGINGQPIYAVADGYVVTSKRLNGSYGNYIIIAHYNGLYTLYAHGQDGSRRVSAGDTVTQGQQIMNVGSTGNSSGPHLHFEVRQSPGEYSNRVNPMGYLP